MQADTDCSLRDIKGRYQGGVISHLLEIQKHKTREEKSLEWARNLQCLSLIDSGHKQRRLKAGGFMKEPAKVLRRICISTNKPHADYVAVSYTWSPSEFENPIEGGYEVELTPRGGRGRSKVRDVVLDRVTTYVKYHKVLGFWIDKECINQDDPEEKQLAINSMDLVYSRSSYPLALLTRPISSQDDLDLLVSLLRGKLTSGGYGRNIPYLRRAISLAMALDILRLLERITSELWWERGWTFQEEYRSSTNMTLLIPHSSVLEKTAHARTVIGDISCELQVSSVEFRRYATLFCLACRQKSTAGWNSVLPISEEILRRAGKYDILHRYARSAGDGRICKSMSPTIFADIGRRKISVPSDTLPITANCCYYAARLKDSILKETKCSLSLCLLALYVLNGEILRNDISDKNLLSGNIFEYLERQSLSNFDPPVGDRELTFLKRCRLHNVRLSTDGIKTTGWLWKLYREIETSEFTVQLTPDRKRSRDGLNRCHRSRLRQLASELKSLGYGDLANDIYKYLDEDDPRETWEEKPSKYYKDLMAIELVQAIEEGKTIQLGCILGRRLKSPPAQIPYRGIFIRNTPLKQKPKPSYVFTVWKPRSRSDDNSGVRTVEKYVSLEVKLEKNSLQDVPRLRTKGWINGLCFFDKSPPGDVIFPWPASLSDQN